MTNLTIVIINLISSQLLHIQVLGRHYLTIYLNRKFISQMTITHTLF